MREAHLYETQKGITKHSLEDLQVVFLLISKMITLKTINTALNCSGFGLCTSWNSVFAIIIADKGICEKGFCCFMFMGRIEMGRIGKSSLINSSDLLVYLVAQKQWESEIILKLFLLEPRWSDTALVLGFPLRLIGMHSWQRFRVVKQQKMNFRVNFGNLNFCKLHFNDLLQACTYSLSRYTIPDSTLLIQHLVNNLGLEVLVFRKIHFHAW